MRIRPVVLVAATAAVFALVLAGCSLLIPQPVSIEDRVARFVNSLNTASRIDVYTNFSEDASDYDEIKQGVWWGDETAGHFPTQDMGTTPYSVASGYATSDPNDVEINISGPLIFGGPKDYKLVMVNVGSSDLPVWMIRELWVWFWNTALPTPAWELRVIVQ